MTPAIPVEDYLCYALNLKQEEITIRAHLLAYLLDTIIDCHAHCNLAKHITRLDAPPSVDEKQLREFGVKLA